MERTRREREHVFARVALPGRRARPERGIRPLPSECTPDGRQRSAVLKVCMDLYLFLSLCLSRYTSSTVGLIIDSALQDPFSLSVSSSAVGLAGVVCTLMAFLLWTVYSTTEHSSQSAFLAPSRHPVATRASLACPTGRQSPLLCFLFLGPRFCMFLSLRFARRYEHRLYDLTT